VQGWLDFALWARDHDLQGPTRRALRRVLILDPANPIANEAVGNVRVGAQWLSPSEAYRAMGYVEFEGQWVRPEERDRVLQGAAVQAERARAEAKGMEAQARARAAANAAAQLQAALAELNRRENDLERRESELRERSCGHRGRFERRPPTPCAVREGC